MKPKMKSFWPGTVIGALQVCIIVTLDAHAVWKFALGLLIFFIGYIVTAMLLPTEPTTLTFNVESISEAEEITNRILREGRGEIT